MVDLDSLANLRLLRLSAPIVKAAGGRPGEPGVTVDGRKVDSELAGIRKPRPSAGWAIPIVNLARKAWGPPTNPTTIAPIWKRDIVFTTALSSFNGQNRADALAHGWNVICVEVLHGQNPVANAAEVRSIGAALRQQGWGITGWGTYGQGSDPAQDARQAAQLVGDLGLDGWVANGEDWAEEAQIGKSKQFVDAWKLTNVVKPLAVSCLSSDTDQSARAFDYGAWLAVPGCAIMPQVYGNVDTGYTWQAARGMLAKGGVPPDRISMTFGTYIDDVKQLPIPYDAYRTWLGPRGAYIGEKMPTGGWARMERQ